MFWFSEVFRGPPRDPLRGRFPSRRLSVLLPLIVLSLETPTRVMDVRAEIVDVRTKPVFSCGPGDGEELVDPRASKRKGQDLKFVFMFFSLP